MPRYPLFGRETRVLEGVTKLNRGPRSPMVIAGDLNIIVNDKEK